MPSDKSGHWLRLRSGQKFYPQDPSVDDQTIQDFVMGCAREGRFANQTLGDDPYSVAQHLVLGSYVIERLYGRQYALPFLTHDLHEGIYKDVPRPIKNCGLDAYRAMEDKALDVLAKHFGFEWTDDISEKVTEVDNLMLYAEQRDLTLAEDHELPAGIEVVPTITPWCQQMARAALSARLSELLSV
jgi:hypothetical protein